MNDYLTLAQATRPATREMGKLLWNRFEVACRKLEHAYFVSDHVWEARAQAHTALNTWYAFACKYLLLRTDKVFYWEQYAEL